MTNTVPLLSLSLFLQVCSKFGIAGNRGRGTLVESSIPFTIRIVNIAGGNQEEKNRVVEVKNEVGSSSIY